MLEVSFEENAISAITHCTQWDYGQDMIIKGLYLPERVEIHFALESQKSALIQIGTTRNETTIVRVPDRLLESGENICAYIYIADEEKGRTVRTIRIFVKKERSRKSMIRRRKITF